MEERKQNLKNLYDIINKIAKQHREKGENVDHWFYTSKQVEELKKESKNRFIK